MSVTLLNKLHKMFILNKCCLTPIPNDELQETGLERNS
jgi:hypothetical protein